MGAKLHFYFSAMNAGKSTSLLQASYNYHERGMRTLIFTPNFDNRHRVGTVASRIGLEADAHMFEQGMDLFTEVQTQVRQCGKVHCVLIDEAQFLTEAQVWQLCRVADELNIPVLAYGLRSDFQGKTFVGSQYLLALADQLTELKTICFCGRKATMNLRINETGIVMREGAQVEIGGNERYLSVCRYHFSSLKQIPPQVLATMMAKDVEAVE